MGASRLVLQAVTCLFYAVTPLSAQTPREQIEELPLNPRPLAMWDFSTQAHAPVLVLPQGTPVCVELTNYISTRTAKRNDKVRFRVVSDVRVEGLTIIPNGAEAWGIVTVARKPRHFSRDGKLQIALQSVMLLNGQTAAIRVSTFSRMQTGKWEFLRGPDSLQGPLLMMFAPILIADMSPDEKQELAGSVLKGIIAKGNQIEQPPGTHIRGVIAQAVELNREEFGNLQPPQHGFSNFLTRSAAD